MPGAYSAEKRKENRKKVIAFPRFRLPNRARLNWEAAAHRRRKKKGAATR